MLILDMAKHKLNKATVTYLDQALDEDLSQNHWP